MRLDKYLKVSRVIKRRTLANEVADAGRVLVNGKPAKASYTVKVGDIIEVTFGNRPVKIRVLSDVDQKGKDVAREMFEIIEEYKCIAYAALKNNVAASSISKACKNSFKQACKYTPNVLNAVINI